MTANMSELGRPHRNMFPRQLAFGSLIGSLGRWGYRAVKWLQLCKSLCRTSASTASAAVMTAARFVKAAGGKLLVEGHGLSAESGSHS